MGDDASERQERGNDAAEAITRRRSPRSGRSGSRGGTRPQTANPPQPSPCSTIAAELGAWDPVVCALRTSRALAGAAWRATPIYDGNSSGSMRKSNDLGLARQAGFRTRATVDPDQLLTPRELEVLGLIARGMRNREIATALFISQSTAKVHVRHVLEKLGVRTRAEAVARLRDVQLAEVQPDDRASTVDLRLFRRLCRA